MLSFIGALPGAVSQGLIWGIMAIGVYITYKILDIADLTVDGSFCTGGAVFVMLFGSGASLWLALLAASPAMLTARLTLGKSPASPFSCFCVSVCRDAPRVIRLLSGRRISVTLFDTCICTLSPYAGAIHGTISPTRMHSMSSPASARSTALSSTVSSAPFVPSRYSLADFKSSAGSEISGNSTTFVMAPNS